MIRGLTAVLLLFVGSAATTQGFLPSLKSLPAIRGNSKEISARSSELRPLHSVASPSLPPAPSNELIPARGGAEVKTLWSKAKVWVYISAWYVLNVYFNIYNKKLLNIFGLPWAVSVGQLGVGAIYILLLWLLRIRKAPTIARKDGKILSVLSGFHAISHITAITSLGAGAVSFTHIVKSAEPFFSAVFAALLFKQFFHPVVYLALIPVVGGVAYASVKELTFSWLSFSCAMASNVVCAGRGVVVKGMMDKPSSDISSENLYGLLTVFGALILVPFMAIFEGNLLMPAIKSAVDKVGLRQFVELVVYSGMTFYLYNEVAFKALESLHPISHAVANTIKRVVVIVASVMVFRNPMSIQSIIGSATAILGVFAYSLAKHYYKK